jgi:hypothetical protein
LATTVRSGTKSFVSAKQIDQTLPLLPKMTLHVGSDYRISR